MHRLIRRMCHMQIYKGSSARKRRTSNKQHGEAGIEGQPTDQLLPDIDTKVWTADEGKIPYEGQQG
ncbi:hypothetical protein pdam_00025293 [Pocillopora damicornis]|uniref:Uncharacterized protein n=1 Tax=Pocillopora damicornis TaxID=46731 RepID=A0A3M6UV83_POCDA|nr:hypothetical protein pdam_00025293 [Pocillopora damicornis]